MKRKETNGLKRGSTKKQNTLEKDESENEEIDESENSGSS